MFDSVRNLLAAMMIVVLVLIFTPATHRIYDWLSVNVDKPPKSDYIVCLGGGWGREVRAAHLWHRKVAPYVIVSNQPGAAEWMRTLVVRAGVPRDKVIIDRTSKTTHDHPTGVAALPGIDRDTTRLVLVTDRNHSRRARGCFHKAGFKHITVYSGLDPPDRDKTYLERCTWRIGHWPCIVYEIAALAKYAWNGWI